MYLSRVETAFLFFLITCFVWIFDCPVGRDSSVGIATRYEVDGLGIESRLRRDFSHLSISAWGPPGLLYKGYRIIHGCKAAGAWYCPPTPSSAEVKDRVEIYILYPSGPIHGEKNFRVLFVGYLSEDDAVWSIVCSENLLDCFVVQSRDIFMGIIWMIVRQSFGKAIRWRVWLVS